MLDNYLQDLPIRRFTMVEKSASGNPDVALSYRLAYGAQFLYFYIEAEADELAYRDRAYQNGDGFAVVLAHPEPGNAPSTEFYVLARSAVDRKSMEWTRKIFWYYNVDHLFTPTSDDTKVAFLSKGESGFSILPPFDAAALNRRLDDARESLSPGSYETHEFTIEEIEKELEGLYSYVIRFIDHHRLAPTRRVCPC